MTSNDTTSGAAYALDAEQTRLTTAREQQVPWNKWGPYLSGRQWTLVREHYSLDRNAWAIFRTIRRARAHR
jgi:hypothetical protein